MNKQDDLWLDSERYDEFTKELRVLCERLGYYINDVVVRQGTTSAPRIEVELMQAPRRKGE